MLCIWQVILALAVFAAIVLADPLFGHPTRRQIPIRYESRRNDTLHIQQHVDIQEFHPGPPIPWRGGSGWSKVTPKPAYVLHDIIARVPGPAAIPVFPDIAANLRGFPGLGWFKKQILIHSKKMFVWTVLCCTAWRGENKFFNLSIVLSFFLKMCFGINQNAACK
jgi:hypothetical protein